MTTIYVCQSVPGALANWQMADWRSVARSNNMTVAEIKEQFRIYDFEGKKVIPIGPPCDGFSYQTGCPGHKVEKSSGPSSQLAE